MIIIRALVLVLVLAASSWAAPQGAEKDRPMMCKPPFERSIEALKPTPDLEKKLRALDEKQGDVLRQARADMRDKKRALYQGLEKTATKEDDLNTLFQNYNTASAALNKARFDSDVQVWRLLTPKQRQIWFTYRKCSRDGMMTPPARPSMPKGPMMDHTMSPKAPPMPMDGDAPMDER
ncbi:MAG: periplasmic heavy metal sensor [Alphaproteobacteria bacterium]